MFASLARASRIKLMQVMAVQIQLITTQTTPLSQILALGMGERSSPSSDCEIRTIHFTIHAPSKNRPDRAKNSSTIPVIIVPAFTEPHPGRVVLSMTHAQARSRLNGVLGITR